MTRDQEITPGTYRHYKGSVYEVVGIAKHSESLEQLVVYKDVEEPTKLWVRPLDMFRETVEVEGEITPRFSKIS